MQYEGLYAVNVQGRRLGIPAKQNDKLGKNNQSQDECRFCRMNIIILLVHRHASVGQGSIASWML